MNPLGMEGGRGGENSKLPHRHGTLCDIFEDTNVAPHDVRPPGALDRQQRAGLTPALRPRNKLPERFISHQPAFAPELHICLGILERPLAIIRNPSIHDIATMTRKRK